MRETTLLSLLLVTACATSMSPVPQAWRQVPQAARIADLCARVTCAAKPASDVRVEGGRLIAAGKPLTPEFSAIQSFDVSLERREVVFSAKRADNFDIGLVSLDGGEIHWLPSDPADETDVQWAPRGNKVSYVVHAAGGDVVRTLHVPTSAQLSVGFPESQVDALAWDPVAERYAVVVESAISSQSVQSVKYDGQQQQEVVAPAVRLEVASEPLRGGTILRPFSMRYNEQLPVVVWVDDRPLAWNDARAALMRGARVAMAVIPKSPDDAFWNELRKLAWVDGQRLALVDPSPIIRDPSLKANITADRTLPPHTYRKTGPVIAVSADDIQSFAAAYLAGELKPNNGLR